MKIELNYVSISYQAPVIHLIFKEGAELGIPEIQELIHYAEKLSGGNPYTVLSDSRVNMDVTHEGRRLAGNAKEAPLNRGCAVLVKNKLYQIAANLFSKFDNPEFPYLVFTDEEKAINWLLQIPTNP